jgi:hypothetical protein
MKKLIVIALVTVFAILTMVGCVSVRAESDLKTPLEWAKIEIASDERYEGKHVMWAVIPVEDSTLTDNEALYFIIAITEESDLVMDWYGVHLEWEEYELTFAETAIVGLGGKVNTNKFSRDQVYIDADLAKTEVIEG